MKRLTLILAAVLALAGLVALAGCKSSKVQGGTARHDTGGFTVEYGAPGGGTVTITDSREYVATTQPSYTSASDAANFKISTAEEGQLGGWSFETKNVTRNATAWGLIGILLLAGVGCYLVRNWIGVGVCAAGVVIAFIAPMFLVWIALAALGLLVWSNRAAVKQLVKGNQAAIEALPPVQATILKDELSKAQDESLKTVVAAVKSTLPSTKA